MAALFGGTKSPQLVPVPTPNQVLTPNQQIQGSTPARAQMGQSFLSSSVALPPPSQGNQGGKQLLGQ